MVQIYHFLIIAFLLGGVEAVIMYRMRFEKLPPGKNRAWWPTSKQYGRGTLAGAAIAWLIAEAIIFQWLVLMEIRTVHDRTSAMEEYCNNRGCMQNLWTQKAFTPALILAMIVSTRNGREPWPRLTKDVSAAVRANQPARCLLPAVDRV
jgi:hypothetical protein